MQSSNTTPVAVSKRFSTVDIPEIQVWLRQQADGHEGAGVWIILAEAERGAQPALQTLMSELGISLVGSVFPALVDNEGIHKQGVILVFWQKMPPYLLIDENVCETVDTAKRVRSFATSYGITESEVQPTLFMVLDAMLPCIGTLLDDLYLELADSVRYAGINAGSETFTSIPALFDENRDVEGGMLVFLLPSADTVLEHGYKEPETLVSATATENNHIMEIDWRPAFDVYSERIREQFGVDITRENFYQHAVHFPFGIQRAEGEVLVRIPVALQDDGSLFCVGEIPEQAVLTLLNAPQVGEFQTAEKLAGSLCKSTGLCFTFYCAGRLMHLGKDAAVDELRVIAQHIAPRSMAGALSLGEIGSSHQGGYPLFHNGTLVAIELSAS